MIHRLAPAGGLSRRRLSTGRIRHRPWPSASDSVVLEYIAHPGVLLLLFRVGLKLKPANRGPARAAGVKHYEGEGSFGMGL